MREDGVDFSVVAEKAKGSTHRINNLPNQDFYNFEILENAIIISVADGHGSAKCKFSDRGSNIAVNVFLNLIIEIYENSKGNSNKFFDDLCAFRKEVLTKRIEKCWKEKVLIDYKKQNPEEKFDSDDEVFEKYGTTLLGLVLTDDFYFAMQLGDGDIVSVFNNGVTERIIQAEKILGVETFSLSSKNAWVNFESFPNKPLNNEDMPVLFIISTDGLANSYADDSAFLQVGVDYLEWFRDENIGNINKELKHILHRTSEIGSGDDITLAIAANINRIKGEDVNDSI